MTKKLDGAPDLRVRRTRKLLQQALIEGASEKGFAALTVRDITERAMVNRATFYHHYLDKYDLLEQHMREMLAVLGEEGGILREVCHEGLIELLKRMQQFPDFYRVMLSTQVDGFLSQRFRQQTQQRFLAHFQQAFPEAASDPDTLPLGLTYTTVASAACGALAWWLEQDRRAPPEQFAHVLQQLIYDMTSRFPRVS